MSDDAWERLRFQTIDQLVTETKLSGSASMTFGRTTPEGYPFVVICAVASPGNEVALQYAYVFQALMARAASFVDRADNPGLPKCDGVEPCHAIGLRLHCPGCLERAMGK